jgi:hypothetical protein
MAERNWSLEPDSDKRWIYDTQHPDYNSDQAKWLRERRFNALRRLPEWMKDMALSNDERKNRDG